MFIFILFTPSIIIQISFLKQIVQLNLQKGNTISLFYQMFERKENEQKKIQIKQPNFLFDVIVPTIYDVDNIKLVQNYMKKLSPTNKLLSLKKAKMNQKISQIVAKVAVAQNQNQIQTKPLLKKYQKQKIKLISQFSKSEVFKHKFNEEITSSINFKQRNKMTMSDLKRQSQSDLQDSTEMKNSQSIYMEAEAGKHQNNNLLLELNDRKFNQKMRAKEQNLELFKEKIKKVIQKSKVMNVNRGRNQINKKVDFYLTQISPEKSYRKIKVIITDQYAFRDYKDYSQEIYQFGKNGDQTNNLENENIKNNQQNQRFVRSSMENIHNDNSVKPGNIIKHQTSLKQFRSVDKLRPKTAGNSTRANSSFQKTRRSTSIFTSTASSKKMRLTHFSPSSSQQNINKKFFNQKQKQKCYNLLDNIQNILEQIPLTNRLLERKINQMKKQWDFQMETNSKGTVKKVLFEGNLPATQQTLILMQQKRLQVLQKMDMQLVK